MSITEKKEKSIQKTEEIEEEEIKYRVKPKYGVYTEEKKVVLQVVLPGVKKESIEIRALKDYFTLRAKRDNIQYVLDLDLGIKIEPEKTESKYKNGLLRIEFIRYKPLEHAFNVSIE